MNRLALVGALLFTLHASAVAAQTGPSEEAIRGAVCPARGGCRIERVVDAGQHGASWLGVVRVRVGPIRCCGEPGYRDYLISMRGDVVRRERWLVRGDCPCLEWHPSRWSYRGGELSFTYGGMGAPPAAGTRTGPTTLHLRPWPLAAVSSCYGDECTTEGLDNPSREPMVTLSME